MHRPRSLFLSLLACIACFAAFLGVTGTASAQVVVYKLRFEPQRSVNLEFYNEGYFVAPATGGAGSFIFTVNRSTEKLYSATSAGKLFFGLTEEGTVKWIVSATTGNSGGNNAGDSGASYVSFGTANKSVRFHGPTFDIRSKIAPSLRGAVTAFSDEGSGEAAAEDGTVSFAAVLDFRMSFDKDRTQEANKTGKTVAETITALIEELERRGFDAETTPAP